MNQLQFPTSPAKHLSEQYVMVDTNQVVRIMQDEGYVVHGIQRDKVRRREPAHARHQIDFRLPDAPTVHGATPRVLFTNSSNGTSRASLMAGVFVFVCSNGLVVGSTYAKESVRHTGDLAKTLIDRVRSLSKTTTPLFRQIEQWSRKDLSAVQRIELARRATILRWGDAERFAPEDLLQVRRDEEDKGDLWTTFNRIQENATKGGLVGRSVNGRAVRSRDLNAILQNTQFNERLWVLAEEFAA